MVTPAPEASRTRVRAALVHLLPPGGGLRAMTELVERTSDMVSYDQFTLDLGSWDRYPADAATRLNAAVSRTVTEPLRLPAALGRLGRASEPLLWRAVIAAERRLAQRIEAGGYDLVVAHNNRYFGASTVLGHLDTPTLFYAQEPRRQGYEYDLDPVRILDRRHGAAAMLGRAALGSMNSWLRTVDITSARAATRILCNSAYSAEAIARAYGRTGHVSPLGVDLDGFTLSTGSRSDHVVSVGAVVPAKGHALVIEALALLDVAERPALVIPHERVDSSYRDELVALAAQHQVRLDLRYAVSDAELNHLYGTALATVCAAHLEPLGLSVYESLATGTPVVAVNEGGFRESVRPGMTGLLVRRDAEALAAGLKQVVDDPAMFDPATLRQAALDGHSWDDSVREYLGHVRAVAGLGAGRHHEED